MNAPLRRLALVSFLLFALLLGSSTWIQAVHASALRNDPRNSRTLMDQLGRERGPIVVDGTSVAVSRPVDDRYKYTRTYPQGPLYAPVTGAYSIASGSTGLEDAEGAQLAGTDGSQFVRRMVDVVTGNEPKGASVTTTINAKVQQAAYNALAGQRGAVVALDPKTGEILAMVSLPSYDPNPLASHDVATASRARQRLLANKQRPLINRAIGGDLYPPGSTFKVVTSAAALQSGSYNADSRLPGPATLKLPQTRSTIGNDWHGACGSGQVSMKDALRISCNTAYASLGMRVGASALTRQAQAFGFGSSLNIPMRVTPSSMGENLNAPQTAQSAIGQYEDRVTPLQMAMVAEGIANGGSVMTPYLVKQVQASDLSVISSQQPQKFSQAVSSQTASTIKDMMVGVVQSGTGRAAQIPGVSVAGKTGTAQTGNNDAAHAWFMSFAPADDPQVAVAVVVENGGASRGDGGAVAAPVAQQVMKAAIDR